MIKIVASNGECVIVEKLDMWEVYDIGTSELVATHEKKQNPEWLHAALFKYDYEEMKMFVETIDAIKTLKS